MIRPATWDDRWLPAAARAVQRAVAAAHRLVRRTTGPGTVVGDGARSHPALAGSATAVAVAGLVLVVAGGPGTPTDHDGSSDTGAVAVAPPPLQGTTLGPTPGTSVASYLSRASVDLRHLGEVARGRPAYAVVDLRRYLTPAQTEALFAGEQVVRAYVRAPAPGLPTQVHAVPLQNTFASLADGMQASGRLAAATAKTFEVLVKQLTGRSGQALALKRRYALQQHASADEGVRLQAPATCACVFAVVVHDSAQQLAALARAGDVRVVDPAPPTATLDAVTVFPLAPEVVTVVPRGGLFGA